MPATVVKLCCICQDKIKDTKINQIQTFDVCLNCMYALIPANVILLIKLANLINSLPISEKSNKDRTDSLPIFQDQNSNLSRKKYQISLNTFYPDMQKHL